MTPLAPDVMQDLLTPHLEAAPSAVLGLVDPRTVWPEAAGVVPPGVVVPRALVEEEQARQTAVRTRLATQEAWMTALEQGAPVLGPAVAWMRAVQQVDLTEQRVETLLAAQPRSVVGAMERLRQVADRTLSGAELASRSQLAAAQLERLALLQRHIPAWADGPDGHLAPTPWLQAEAQVAELTGLVETLRGAPVTPQLARMLELAQLVQRQAQKWREAVSEAVAQEPLGADWTRARGKRAVVASRAR